jgi:hypothetical protein
VSAASISAKYVLVDDYKASKFADMFNFFTGNDPTNGYVNYVDRAMAERTGIYKLQNGKVSFLGVHLDLKCGAVRSFKLIYRIQPQITKSTNSSIQPFIGVDKYNIATGRGRNSIRLESKKRYNKGLFILSLQHMPASTCGSWPAFWLVGKFLFCGVYLSVSRRQLAK